MLEWNAGVDYITTTWPMRWGDTPLPVMPSVIDWVQRQLGEGRSGDWLRPWAWQGYVGWTIGGVSVGEKADSSIVRCSSALAQAWCEAGLPTGHNVSRIDLQLTFFGQNEQDAAIARHNDEAVASRRAHEGRPIKVTYVNGNGGGDTLYLGSRASETYVRIYNKEKEAATDERWKGAIRYEVEFKGERARAVREQVAARGYSPWYTANLVVNELNYRGVVLPAGASIPELPTRVLPKPAMGLESSLVWLERQVSPTVRRLLGVVDRDVILMALGLHEKE
jgi:hypothetical protein